eukprot:470896-Rhodomonas_salina.8
MRQFNVEGIRGRAPLHIWGCEGNRVEHVRFSRNLRISLNSERQEGNGGLHGGTDDEDMLAPSALKKGRSQEMGVQRLRGGGQKECALFYLGPSCFRGSC